GARSRPHTSQVIIPPLYFNRRPSAMLPVPMEDRRLTDQSTGELIDALARSLATGNFVKLTLGKGRGGHRQAFIRLIEIRKEPHLTILIRKDGAADLAENHPISAAPQVVRELLESKFGNAHLFT